MNERLKELAEQAELLPLWVCVNEPTGSQMIKPIDQDIIKRFADLVRQDERADREWCGNAENPVKCIGHNDLCRGFTCKHFAEFLHEKNRILSQEIDRTKTSKDICGNE